MSVAIGMPRPDCVAVPAFNAKWIVAGNDATFDASKIAVFVASLLAGVLGYLWLRYFCPPPAGDA
jgi:hypothetical protein